MIVMTESNLRQTFETKTFLLVIPHAEDFEQIICKEGLHTSSTII